VSVFLSGRATAKLRMAIEIDGGGHHHQQQYDY